MEKETSEECEMKEDDRNNSIIVANANKCGRMRFILNKGWMVGKKIVITGVAISSAPIVLPPLFVVSTIGFCFAVPFSFILASYACTDKIMSKLLSSPNLEVPLIDDEDKELKEIDEKGVNMDREFEELDDDPKLSLESRIELIGNDQNVDEKGLNDATATVEEKEYQHGYVIEEVEVDGVESEVTHIMRGGGPIMDMRDYNDVYEADTESVEEPILIGMEEEVVDADRYKVNAKKGFGEESTPTKEEVNQKYIGMETDENTHSVGQVNDTEEASEALEGRRDEESWEKSLVYGNKDSSIVKEHPLIREMGEVVKDSGYDHNKVATFTLDDIPVMKTYEFTEGFGSEAKVVNVEQVEETKGLLDGKEEVSRVDDIMHNGATVSLEDKEHRIIQEQKGVGKDNEFKEIKVTSDDKQLAEEQYDYKRGTANEGNAYKVEPVEKMPLILEERTKDDFVHKGDIDSLDQEKGHLIQEQEEVGSDLRYKDNTANSFTADNNISGTYGITRGMGYETSAHKIEPVEETLDFLDERSDEENGNTDRLEDGEQHMVQEEDKVVLFKPTRENSAEEFKADNIPVEEIHLTREVGDEPRISKVGHQINVTKETKGPSKEGNKEENRIIPVKEDKPAECTYQMAKESEPDSGDANDNEQQVIPVQEMIVNLQEPFDEKRFRELLDEEEMRVKQMEKLSEERGVKEQDDNAKEVGEKPSVETNLKIGDPGTVENIVYQVKQTEETVEVLEEVLEDKNLDLIIEEEQSLEISGVFNHEGKITVQNIERQLNQIDETMNILEEIKEEGALVMKGAEYVDTCVEGIKPLTDTEEIAEEVGVKQMEKLAAERGAKEHDDIANEVGEKPSIEINLVIEDSGIIDNIVEQVKQIEETAEVLEEILEEKKLDFIIEDEKPLESAEVVSQEGKMNVKNIERQLNQIDEKMNIFEEKKEEGVFDKLVEEEVNPPMERTKGTDGAKYVDTCVEGSPVTDTEEVADVTTKEYKVPTSAMKVSRVSSTKEQYLEIANECGMCLFYDETTPALEEAHMTYDLNSITKSVIPKGETLIEDQQTTSVSGNEPKATTTPEKHEPSQEVNKTEAQTTDEAFTSKEHKSSKEFNKTEALTSADAVILKERKPSTEVNKTEDYTVADTVTSKEHKPSKLVDKTECLTTRSVTPMEDKPSKEALYEEEKIWELIDSMRKIVGYKASHQLTCIDELKALYLFTGVEPPDAFKDESDLVEVNDKLRILMAIVGVK